MSKISNLIFNGVSHKVTSPYGNRGVIKTSAGNTSSFHEGTDYAATGTKKSLDQFAIEDGYVFAAAKSNSDGALYVWVIYPRVKLAMLHYHLASYSVKAGQKVSKGTKLGVTGKTGKATGIHLHLGIRDLSKLKDVNKMTWDLLRTCPYVDPEKVVYSEGAENKVDTKVDYKKYLPSRGWIAKGDKSDLINKISQFMYKTFPSYTSKYALGSLYGPYLMASVLEFQRRTGMSPKDCDGLIGAKTLAKMVEYGLEL